MIFRRSRKQAPPAPPRTPSTVTIEDLLQLKKRAEQPPPEFWTDFDRQLKERQRAAAIQEKQPAWWRVFPRIAVAIPAGATAAFAIGFIVWRNAPPVPPPSPAPDTLEQRNLPSAQNTPVALATPAPRAAEPAIAQPEPAATVAVASIERTPARVTAAEAAATQSVAPQHLETARDAFASITPTRKHRSGNAETIVFYDARPQTAKTTTPAATLFQMPVVIDSDLVAALPAPATNVQPAATTEADTEAMQEASDPRRARLLTYTDNTMPVAAATTDNPRLTRLRDRVTSRFDDKSLSDSISRIATTGDSLTIKF